MTSFEKAWKRSFHKIKTSIVAELDEEKSKIFKKKLTENISLINKQYYNLICKNFNAATGEVKRSMNEFQSIITSKNITSNIGKNIPSFSVLSPHSNTGQQFSGSFAQLINNS